MNGDSLVLGALLVATFGATWTFAVLRRVSLALRAEE
jgi:hypothetical protein